MYRLATPVSALVSAVLLCVQRYWEKLYLTAPKAVPSGKE